MIIFYLGARFQGDELSTGTGLSFLAFLIIGTGSLGCILGGWVSRRIGEKKLAKFSLMVSCILCFFSGVFYELNSGLLVALLLIWGFFVVSDSPQFSALDAHDPVLLKSIRRRIRTLKRKVRRLAA